MQNATVTMSLRRDGWAKGKARGFQFEALVFGEPSEHGMEGGRISKLFIYQDGDKVLSYDRGWEHEPNDPRIREVASLLRSVLEALPA